jgi:Leucine-rich repeat (LRR) protein
MEYQSSATDINGTSVTLEQLGALVTVPSAYKIFSHFKQDRSHHVQRLHLRRNQLSYLPANFELLLCDLTDLSLRGNELVQFPPEIILLKHLVKLSLASNGISYIPPEISKLRHLEWLNVAANTIDDLPRELTKCKRLTHLDIQKNRFKCMDNSFIVMMLELISYPFVFSPSELYQSSAESSSPPCTEEHHFPAGIGSISIVAPDIEPIFQLPTSDSKHTL